jgi:hypothetical protein
MKLAVVLILLAGLAPAQQDSAPVLVLAPSSRDYLFGAGGTLANDRRGRPVYVLLFGNEEKDSAGLGPNEGAASDDGGRAAKALR